MNGKMYLDSGEVINLNHCKTCGKDFQLSEPKVEDVDPVKEFPTAFSRWMYDKLGKELVTVTGLRTCECGTFPDITIKIKDEIKHVEQKTNP